MKTVSTYVNNRNKNKRLIVVHYPCGHYYFRQYMAWENGVINPVGGGNGRHRVRKSWLKELLTDYDLVWREEK